MEDTKKSGGVKTFVSAVYLILSIALLLGVCGYCYPQLGQRAREAIAGMEDSPVREAFGVLADGFVESRPAKEVLAESYEVLTGEAS